MSETLVFSPTGSNSYQDWANSTTPITITAGATFDMKITYGTLGWDDLSVFMMRSSGTNALIYGPYEGSWYANGSTLNLFTSINDASDAATAEDSGIVTFPISMPADLIVGEVVVIRFLIHGTDVGIDPCPTSAAEVNYCDYVFVVAENETTALEISGIRTKDGGIYGADNLQIFNLIGQDVTHQNGQLANGIYLVKLSNKVLKVFVRN